MTTIRKGIRSLAVAGALLAASALSTFSTGFAADKTIKMVPRGDLNILDPIWSTVAVTRNYGFMVYDMLYALDAKFQPQPQMLEKSEVSADGLTYTMTLRAGLKWHDGAPVTAADCVASIERWSKRNLLGQQIATLKESLEAKDDKTIVLKIKEKFDVPGALAQPTGSPAFMMPKRIAETDANTQIKETIGSGPFIFKKEEWKPGNLEVFVKNPDYIPRKEPASFLAGGKVVKVDRVEWIHMPDPATIMAALVAGEIDYYENPSTDFLPIFEKNKDIKIVDLDPMGSQGTLRLNHLHPPFNNEKIRQAVLHAIDRETYSKAVIGDARYYWKDCHALFGCGSPFQTDAGAVKKKDIAKAKALLKEGGYNNEKVVVMDPSNVPVLHAAVMVTVDALRSIGMNVEVQAMDVGTMIRRRASKDAPEKGGWNVFHTQFQGVDIISPASHQYITAGCEKAPPGWPCDKQLEELRQAFLKETNPATQKEIATKMQVRAYEFVPYIAVGQWKQPVAYRSSLSGVLESAATVFWNIEKK
jgi:peptide/nickel transport system substrate-binding protein